MTFSQGAFWALAWSAYWITTTVLEAINPRWRLPDWGM